MYVRWCCLLHVYDVCECKWVANEWMNEYMFTKLSLSINYNLCQKLNLNIELMNFSYNENVIPRFS